MLYTYIGYLLDPHNIISQFGFVFVYGGNGTWSGDRFGWLAAGQEEGRNYKEKEGIMVFKINI
jgi:hypothetical protein